MSKYLLSIIIPTRNRQQYCKSAVEQVISHRWENVEVCIQDNSDEDALRNWVDKQNNPNIVYNYHSGILSFVDNFSEAVSLAHGDYLCMIGDDDGILPSILPLVEEMSRQQADAAIPALNYIYFWPSEQHIVENNEKGLLISHLHTENPRKSPKLIFDIKGEIVKLLRNGIQGYTSFDIPRLYHGIVRRDILEKVKAATGHYFGGLTPDMYMAVALSLTCKSVLKVNYSVTISGICPTSGSSDSATGKHTGELKDAPHFRGHDEYIWEKMMPAFYSVDTIWGDTLFHALQEFGREDLTKLFNLPLFLGICIEKYPEYSNLLLQHAKEHGCTKTIIKVQQIKYKMKVFEKRVNNKLRRSFLQMIGKPITRKDTAPNILTAERIITSLS